MNLIIIKLQQPDVASWLGIARFCNHIIATPYPSVTSWNYNIIVPW